MIISISGSPGTGKSRIAECLAEKLNANLICIKDIVEKGKYELDKKRKTKIIDVKQLQKEINKKIRKNSDTVIEGHLSHLLNADKVLILRCRPDILRARLEKRGWNKTKIEENIKAEILDSAVIEAVARHGKNVFEIDTTRLNVRKAVDNIINILNNFSLQNKYKVGHIDWSEKFMKDLIE